MFGYEQLTERFTQKVVDNFYDSFFSWSQGLDCKDQDVVPTGRWSDAGTGRPISEPRHDLHRKQWAPVSDLVNLEPLTEP